MWEIYLLNAIGLTPAASSTIHIYTQTILSTTQLIWEVCRPCPVFASYTLAFALQLRKGHGKSSVSNNRKKQRNLPITEEKVTDFFFIWRQVPFHAGTWNLDARNCKCTVKGRFPLFQGSVQDRLPCLILCFLVIILPWGLCLWQQYCILRTSMVN